MWSTTDWPLPISAWVNNQELDFLGRLGGEKVLGPQSSTSARRGKSFPNSAIWRTIPFSHLHASKETPCPSLGSPVAAILLLLQYRFFFGLRLLNRQ
jgi:hypothetical protein